MLLNRLKVRYPIFQAPMAGLSTPHLAAAVSNSGGLGILGLGASNVKKARLMIEETCSLTKRPIVVNLFCHRPAVRDPMREEQWLKYLDPLFEAVGAQRPDEMKELYKSFLEDPEMLCMLLEQRPDVVTFHFGIPPTETIQTLSSAGIYTMATATNLQEALAIARAGIDAIVAQGFEAGGHRGVFDPHGKDECLSTVVLLRILARKIELPLVAAGGIMDGFAARAMLDAGASAVQLGTAYVLCPESAVNAGYREDLKDPDRNCKRFLIVLLWSSAVSMNIWNPSGVLNVIKYSSADAEIISSDRASENLIFE